MGKVIDKLCLIYHKNCYNKNYIIFNRIEKNLEKELQDKEDSKETKEEKKEQIIDNKNNSINHPSKPKYEKQVESLPKKVQIDEGNKCLMCEYSNFCYKFFF